MSTSRAKAASLLLAPLPVSLRALGLLLVLLPARAPSAHAQEGNATSVSSTIYVRTDSDRTTVITPRLRASAALTEETQLSLVYAVDVWTSASIDIRTSASKAVTEQRDEIDVGLTQKVDDLSLRGSYRYSTEYDYESHGGSVGASLDLAQKSTTLAVDLGALYDRAGRAGDPDSFKPVSMQTGRFSFTQILDPDTLVQLTYEHIRQQGYLSSPYRYIPIGLEDEPFYGRCQYPLATCIEEVNPEERARHAVALRARRALGDMFSIGAGYRFYTDDWDLLSHTAHADVAWVPDEGWVIELGYRYYDQSGAGHYEPFYLEEPSRSHYTNDKELSPLSVHSGKVSLERVWSLDDLGSELKTVLTGSPSYYQYHDFPRLSEITAFEVTFSAEVAL